MLKCWNLTFNAQGSRVIIVVVQVRSTENICSSSGGAQERHAHGRQDETQFTTKIGGKTSMGPSYFVL
jgi:hypothetical protein